MTANLPKISIIIPILNEEKALDQLLPYLLATIDPEHIAEIIVVDGGSTDHSKRIVDTYSTTVEWIDADHGRAKQMNAGREKATGRILYFLHADSTPPPNFDRYILEAYQNQKYAGCFRMRFDSTHWWLRFLSWCTRFSSRICRGGDQSLFVTTALFDEIKGYDESYALYEDHIFISELYRRKHFTVLPYWLTTSARKYHSVGVWRLQYYFAMIYLKKWTGATPTELQAYYQDKVGSRNKNQKGKLHNLS